MGGNEPAAEGNEPAVAAWFYDLAPSIRDFHSRFISTFKRDKLKTADPADIQVIAGGNRAAHNGNCKIDADYIYDSRA